MPKPGASSLSDDSESSSSSSSTSTGALSGRCGGVCALKVDPVTGSKEPAGVLREAKAVLSERGGFAGGYHEVSMQLNFWTSFLKFLLIFCKHMCGLILFRTTF
jgi:hypothetical protein